ncbi:conserved hypothetical protein [Nitrobacter hamburgensis X14]|uniref:ATP-grasp domain-containing protein n=1 Tax=Nitrobacter hamburgensis (strain DSM 10229 / NCIMB 13809 / X14) TaxID=323097 RepID=Q1QRQ7_NITHX|nr:ATP-grasp domain-containing protein [Nitrobacter hamburgensis]ABE61090.1 conserved hypothetical protein [Nitrobacter hamburgensis X14]
MGGSGVVILGGAHGTLALARSLGTLKIPVVCISNDRMLPSWSRYVEGPISWPGHCDGEAVSFLARMAKERKWDGYLLVPAGDGEVRFVSENRAALSATFKIMLPGWDSLRWLCDKPFLYRRADELNVKIPRTHRLVSVEQAETLAVTFPVVLKPNMGGGNGPFFKAKVVRADDQAELARAYRDAAGQIGAANVVVQELIPGGGESQFSYAALWHDGQPVTEFTARRTRQYPVDFGYTSTFVEVVDEPRAIEAARTMLASVGFGGLVEVEFKRDHRDGSLKLLDVNPRPWSWFGLCAAAGVDLGAMMWQVANGRPAKPAVAQIGVSWMYLVRDFVVAMTLLVRGRIGVGDYLRSFGRVRAWAAFALNDPLPGVIDLPLTAWRVLTRRVLKIG